MSAMSSAAHPAIALPELRRRYEALGPLPQFPGDRSWVDRVRGFDGFVEYGADVADYMRKTGRGPGTPDDESIVRDCPALFRLLMQAFPAASGEERHTR